MGFLRFDGHPPSGAQPRKGCPKWRPWRGRSPVPVGRSPRSSRLRSSSAAGAATASIGQVARDFDLTETAVRAWVKQAEIDAGERPGLTTEEREELARLRRENRQLREDVEILKRATVFFAKETR